MAAVEEVIFFMKRRHLLEKLFLNCTLGGLGNFCVALPHHRRNLSWGVYFGHVRLDGEEGGSV